MLAVREHLDRLGDTLPVVVTFTDDPARQAAYGPHLGIDFPVLADPERELYRLFGARRGSFRRVWSPGSSAPTPCSTAVADSLSCGCPRAPTTGPSSRRSPPLSARSNPADGDRAVSADRHDVDRPGPGPVHECIDQTYHIDRINRIV